MLGLDRYYDWFSDAVIDPFTRRQPERPSAPAIDPDTFLEVTGDVREIIEASDANGIHDLIANGLCAGIGQVDEKACLAIQRCYATNNYDGIGRIVVDAMEKEAGR